MVKHSCKALGSKVKVDFLSEGLFIYLDLLRQVVASGTPQQFPDLFGWLAVPPAPVLMDTGKLRSFLGGGVLTALDIVVKSEVTGTR